MLVQPLFLFLSEVHRAGKEKIKDRDSCKSALLNVCHCYGSADKAVRNKNRYKLKHSESSACRLNDFITGKMFVRCVQFLTKGDKFQLRNK